MNPFDLAVFCISVSATIIAEKCKNGKKSPQKSAKICKTRGGSSFAYKTVKIFYSFSVSTMYLMEIPFLSSTVFSITKTRLF